MSPLLRKLGLWERTIGTICGNPTSRETLNVFDVSRAWNVHTKVRDPQLGISQGLLLGVEGGAKGSIGGSSNTCRKGMRLEWILTRGLPTGNELCHISLSIPIVVTV